MEAPENCCNTEFKVLSTGEYILPPPLQASIDQIVKKEGYITHKTIKRSISTSGGNFLADLYEVDIKGKTVDGDKETNIFIKNKMEDPQITCLSVEGCYSMENFFYGKLSKLYDDIQNKANIPLEERYNIVKSYDATNPDAIILENLAKKGFSTIHRMEVAPLQFVQLSVQQLARFHGLSWVLEKQHPEYFAKNIKSLSTVFKFNEEYKSFVENMSTYTDKCLDKDEITKLDNFRSCIVKLMNKYYFENAEVTCSLCHGDYRANNILVKMNGNNVSEVIPVDYQLMYYGCPVMDLIYFIFPCTDQDFRKKHLDDIKNLYFDSLEKFLKYFDMDVKTVYPRVEFEKEYKERLAFGLITSLILSPILFTDDSDVPDIASGNLGSFTVTPDPIMDERIKGLVDDFQNWGIL